VVCINEYKHLHTCRWTADVALNCFRIQHISTVIVGDRRVDDIECQTVPLRQYCFRTPFVIIQYLCCNDQRYSPMGKVVCICDKCRQVGE
jgi:hypothetical protein